MTSTAVFPAAAAAESVDRVLAEICGTDGEAEELQWEPPRRFHGYAQRLRHILAQLLRSSPPGDLSGPSVHTALHGMAADLDTAAAAFSKHRGKSQIFVLLHCKPLCNSLQESAISIGNWLALLLDSPLPFSNPDIRKKAADLALDLQQTNLRKEGELRVSNKAVQSAIVMDLARALGVEAGDHEKLAEQLKLLKRDLSGLSSVAERRILISLEKIFDGWAAEPYTAAAARRSNAGGEEEDSAHVPPYRNFLCPLTKEVMRDPVLLESLQTYERSAIDHWFERCLQDGREPTCPVSGQVLKTLALKPNLSLAGPLRSGSAGTSSPDQVRFADPRRGGRFPIGALERAMDNVYMISEEHPSSRYRVRNAGIVVLMVRVLESRRKATESHLRAIALMALHSMSRDEESKLMMLHEGMTRLAIRSLTSSLEDEKEFAVKLLLEFSRDEGYCANMAGDPELPILSKIAEDILKNMEKMEENIQPLAAAGRFQPLLTRLCEDRDGVPSRGMSLASGDKEHIARKCGRILIVMLSSRLEARAASLRVLKNLSTLDDNAAVLVDFGALPHEPPGLKELAASTMANIVSKPGHWELASADRERNRMQSEVNVHRLLEFLSSSSSTSECQAAVLQILCGIASSPQASDSAASYVRSGNGVGAIVPFLEHPEADCRIYAYQLASLLSERLALLKEKLLDARSSSEKTEVAAILANLPIPGDLVKKILGMDLLRWTVVSLNEQRFRSMGRNSRRAASMVEGLLGILLHYTRSGDPEIIAAVSENQLMAVFKEHLSSRSQPRERQRAALGLKQLSHSAAVAAAAAADSTRVAEPRRRSLCAAFLVLCGAAAPAGPAACVLHGAACGENNSLCLVKGSCVKPLIYLMNDEDTQVQIAAVEALSTLVAEPQGLSSAASELAALGLFKSVVDLFKRVRVGELHEKLIWMVEKLCNSDELVQRYSTDQALVRSLVEALKHGTPNAKRSAQEALTSLQQLSAIGIKTATNRRPRRLSR
ncbi:unnamed protein product [Spirodela intermedia]|uniref:RING-type E3 ubiquitin transferase n=1 Tax=Spirodela intermedia TaxID=51605 RepID=A0A7I8JID9_SPIIN|nr:unnamed protein product [Spirodela intermedia]CAA6669313.1 unnamed protein product [Spirodela intermedia]